MISKTVVGLQDVLNKQEGDRIIRKESKPIIKETIASIRAQMRSMGFYDSGISEKSFKHKFLNNGGFLEGISITAQRNIFVLAHAGQDYNWSIVAGRRKLFNMKPGDDFLFNHVDVATEKIADLVAEHRADAVVKGTRFLNKDIRI